MSTHSQKHTWFYNVGWIFIGVGLLVFAKGIYNAQEVVGEKEFREAIGMLISLCGMLFTVSALFFTVDNLTLQRATLVQQNESINQQKEAIELQKDELKIQNAEMKASNEYFKQQNKTLQQQRFENTFFQLLNSHQEIVRGLEIRSDYKGNLAVISKGRECFEPYLGTLDSMANGKTELKDLIAVYDNFYAKYQTSLGHYFRNLYHIFKYIATSEDILMAEKFKYTQLVRAQLSHPELILLFWNCLSENGASHFKPLVKEYSVLKNAKHAFSPEHKKEYDEMAFASSEEREALLYSRQLK